MNMLITFTRAHRNYGLAIVIEWCTRQMQLSDFFEKGVRAIEEQLDFALQCYVYACVQKLRVCRRQSLVH